MRSRLAVAVFVVFSSATIALAGQERQSLSILLTNDDGVDAPGIQAMRRALVAAGHRVTVVAPAGQQSGSSGRVTIRNGSTIRVEEREQGVWAVDGSPADAVFVASEYVLPDTPLDLVVSGSNFGQNLGRVTNASGTVGAAIVGTRRAPAIAVSVGVRPDEAEATPIPYPSTLAAFGPAAEFIVHLVDALVESRTAGSRLLPDGTFLNVNYPALDVSNIRGVSMARLGMTGLFRVIFVETDAPGQLQAAVERREAVESDGPEDADTRLFSQGHVTITLLSADRSAGLPVYDTLATRLEGLALPSAGADVR